MAHVWEPSDPDPVNELVSSYLPSPCFSQVLIVNSLDTRNKWRNLRLGAIALKGSKSGNR